MDINQIARMIEWLDEERRRDKNTMISLQERIRQQQETITTLQRQLRGVESDQAFIKETNSSTLSGDTLEKLRTEMRQLLERSETRRLTAEREAERRRDLDRESLMHKIEELQIKLDRYEKQSADVSGLKTERDRLSDSMAVLQQRIDDLTLGLEEPDRRIAFLEEQRRLDTRRLSTTESELPEIKKALDGINPKLVLIEELALRNERRLQEFHNAEQDRREQIQQFIDQQNLLDQQRNQEIGKIATQMDAHTEQMKSNTERFETWAQAYREMKRIIDDFERIGDRLERRINEVAEMQRLSEERFRTEWNDWRDEDQKRWKQFTLASDEIWRKHDREFEEFKRGISSVNEGLPAVRDSVNRLWELERKRAAMYQEKYQSLLLEHDQIAKSDSNGG